MTYVPQIIINGVRLSRAEAVTVQVAVADLQQRELPGGGAIGDAIAMSYRVNASNVLRIMGCQQGEQQSPPEPAAALAQPARPLSRAEEHILSLAGRSIGYAPNKGGPWWKVIAPWHVRKIRERLQAEGLISLGRRPDGRVAFYRVVS